MTGNEWWKKPKSHEQRHSQEVLKKYVSEVERAANVIGGEDGARIRQHVAQSIANRQDSLIAQQRKQADFKALQEREVQARNGVNPMGFFTDKGYGRSGPNSVERLEIQKMKAEQPAPAFDWNRLSESARERQAREPHATPDRSKDRDQEQ